MKAKLARLLLWMAGKVGHNSFEYYDKAEHEFNSLDDLVNYGETVRYARQVQSDNGTCTLTYLDDEQWLEELKRGGH